MIADRNYCYVCRVGVTYDEEKIKTQKKYHLFIILFWKLKKVFNYLLTSIRLAMNFECITIK